MILGFIAWYLVGIILFLYTCYRVEGQLTIGDLIMSLVAGSIGLVNILFLITYGKFKFLDKRIF